MTHDVARRLARVKLSRAARVVATVLVARGVDTTVPELQEITGYSIRVIRRAISELHYRRVICVVPPGQRRWRDDDAC